MPWRFLAVLLALALYVALRTMQRRPKCPCCFARVVPDWRGQAGYCPRCGWAGWGAREAARRG